MNPIARVYLKGMIPSQIATSCLAMLSLFVQPVMILMGAGIALIAMSVGPSSAVLLSLTVVLITGLTHYFSFGGWLLGVLFSGFFCIALIAAAAALSRYFKVAQAALMLAGFSALLVLLLNASISAEQWQVHLQELFKQLSMPVEAAVLESVVEKINQTIGLGMFLLLMSSLLLGRFWQSQAYKPKAFGAEFRQYNLGKPSALVISLIFIAGIFQIALVEDLIYLAVSLFLLQGLAVIHALLITKQAHWLLIVVLYLLIVFLPAMMLMVALVGWCDVWFNLKNRLQQPNSS